MCKQFRNLSFVSTSDAQRRPLAWVSWRQTIYPGVLSELYRWTPRPGKYLAFIGGLSLEEGLGLAIELAGRIAGFPLSIPVEFLVVGHGVKWCGKLIEVGKSDFLGEALALVCTQGGPSPSGLCVAEALACGTPVVAFHGGNAAEMI